MAVFPHYFDFLSHSHHYITPLGWVHVLYRENRGVNENNNIYMYKNIPLNTQISSLSMQFFCQFSERERTTISEREEQRGNRRQDNN